MTDQYCLNVKQKTLDSYVTAQSPGPAYSPDYSPAYPRSPTYKFGTSSRDGKRGENGPSPSEYDVANLPTSGHIKYDSRKKSTQLYKFGSSNRSGTTTSDTPGPGAYVYDQYKGGRPVSAYSRWRTPPAYSLGTSGRDSGSPRGGAPGPAEYGAPNGIGRQCLSTRPSSANFRFGSGSREGSRERPRSPGPIYDVPNGLGKQSVSNRRTSPSSKFGTSSRDERRIEHSPAPGDHDYREKPGKSLFGKNPPSWGMGTSSRNTKDPHAEGPGPDYNVEGGIGKQVTSTRPSSANYRFGTSGRDQRKTNDDVPGPGAHRFEEPPGKNLKGRNCPTFRFGSARRDAGGPRSESPGPCYSLPSRPSSPQYRFGTSMRDDPAAKSRGQGPGPASYMFEEPPGKNLKGKNAATFRFGTSSRDGPRRADQSPGPGNYGTLQGIGKQPISTKRTSASSKFGSGSRFAPNKSANTPSPAEYVMPSGMPGGPKWSMLSR